MSVITDKSMQAKATLKDQWLNQPFKRGSGVFVGRITRTGERLFYFRYSDGKGQRKFFPIGSYHQKGKSGLSLSSAYAKACELAELHRDGQKDLHNYFKQKEMDEVKADALKRLIDLELETQRTLESERRISIKKLFSKWQSVELKSHKTTDGKRIGRKDNGLYTLNQFTRHVFPTIGDIPANEIKKSDVLSILDNLKSEGKLRTCNVLLADLKQMFKFAVKREVIPFNPIETLTKRDAGGPENESDRFLTYQEIFKLSRIMPTAKLAMRSQYACWLILSTGCRVGELLKANWSDVDLINRRWRIPETKNERPHNIHLSEFATNYFQQLKDLQQTNHVGVTISWVFPNRKLNGAVCIKSLNKQTADRQRANDLSMKNRSKMTSSLMLDGGKWRPHDLRRTSATCMSQLGFSADVIDECLNHKIQSRMTRIYIRDRREMDQAKAFDALGQLLSDLTTQNTKISNVTSLRQAKQGGY